MGSCFGPGFLIHYGLLFSTFFVPLFYLFHMFPDNNLV
jgi:hypothetical protein